MQEFPKTPPTKAVPVGIAAAAAKAAAIAAKAIVSRNYQDVAKARLDFRNMSTRPNSSDAASQDLPTQDLIGPPPKASAYQMTAGIAQPAPSSSSWMESVPQGLQHHIPPQPQLSLIHI